MKNKILFYQDHIINFRKSEALLKLEETKEVAGMPLTATGPFNSGSLINKMVTDMTKAISIRFADLLDEVKFTEIANLRNWPLEELKGNNI